MQFKLNPNNKYTKLRVLDAHTEGEPLRIIKSGYPVIKGDTILKKRQYVSEHLDHLRQTLMFEPRGHADMYGALLTEATTPDGDFGILFMHNEGYSSMCGHGILATITAMYECNEFSLTENETKVIKIDSPAGRITAYATLKNRQFKASFDCVPSYVEVTNQTVMVAGLGEVTYDIAFGGAFYAYVDADALDLDCRPEKAEQLIQAGRAIKRAVMEAYPLSHPQHSDLAFLYGTIFTSRKTTETQSHSRHVCIFADGELDRSPTGTGVSGRIALLHHKGEVESNKTITIESIISSKMEVSGSEKVDYFGKNAIIPRVSGRAYITGESEFLVDENDPFRQGFILR